MLRSIAIIVWLCLAHETVQAALLGRAPATPNGTDYQAYFDTVLNITWVADANLSMTSGYSPTGMMTWSAAQTWIGSLNTANYLGVSDWRLPITPQPDASCSMQFNPGSGFPLQGSGTNCTGSEMGYLYNVEGISFATPGPFTHLNSYYWSVTQYAPNPTSYWNFLFSSGTQTSSFNLDPLRAWAVRTGDIALAHQDSDGDGITDDRDNCTLVPNANQRDTNGDGYGNICDPDFNGDGVVNINDLNRLKARLNITPVVDVDTDLDGNGAVNINDLNRLKSFLGKPPGPSGLHPNCPPTCP
jgi:hypothetical protein